MSHVIIFPTPSLKPLSLKLASSSIRDDMPFKKNKNKISHRLWLQAREEARSKIRSNEKWSNGERAFVKRSASWSKVGDQGCRHKFELSFFFAIYIDIPDSLVRTDGAGNDTLCRCMCFVRQWNSELCTSLIALWLSGKSRVVWGCGYRK